MDYKDIHICECNMKYKSKIPVWSLSYFDLHSISDQVNFFFLSGQKLWAILILRVYHSKITNTLLLTRLYAEGNPFV